MKLHRAPAGAARVLAAMAAIWMGTGAQEVAAAPVRGVTETEIVFGMTGPFSGPTQALGWGMKAGIEAAFAEANGMGGVHGRKLRLVTADDGYEPARTATASRGLVEKEGVFGFVGCVGTAPTAVVAPYAAAHRVLLFGALTGAPEFRKAPPERYVFNYRASYIEETAAAVRQLVDARGIPPAAIAVVAQQDAFGEAGAFGVVAQLGRYGVPAQTVKRAWYQRNSADVKDAIAMLRAAKEVRAVVLVSTAKPAAELVRAMERDGRELAWATVSFVNADALAELLAPPGRKFRGDLMAMQVVPPPTSNGVAALRYRASLKKHDADAPPRFVSFEGYLAATMLVDALRRAGPELDTERLVAALEGTQGHDPGIGAAAGFSAREHQALHRVWAVTLQPDGTWEPVAVPGHASR